MNGCVGTDNKKQIVSAFGIDGSCYVYRLRPKVITQKVEETGRCLFLILVCNILLNFSLHLYKTGIKHTSGVLFPAVDGVRKRKKNPMGHGDTNSASKILSYDVELLGSVQTDFSSGDGYQRAVRFTQDISVMVTGGADGSLRTWKVFCNLSV